ncbi:MAG: chemotaxis protein CheW [Pseudomonadota bacterium]
MSAATTGKEGLGLFRLDDRLIGVPVQHLAEVCKVTELSPIIMRAPGLIGSLSLRGAMIPVLDLMSLSNHGTPNQDVSIALILRGAGRLVGIRLDGMEGFTDQDPGNMQVFHGADAAMAAFSKTMFLYKGNPVAIIDAEGLFARTDIPTVDYVAKAAGSRNRARGIPHLTFTVGKARLAIDARAIKNTVPRRAVDQNALTVGSCLGSIEQNKRRIPVMNTAELLGIGDANLDAETEIVLLRLSQDRLLGLAVNSIDSVSSLDPDGFSPAPAILTKANAAVPYIHHDEDGSQTFIAAAEGVERLPALESFAAISETAEPEANRPNPADTDRKVVFERDKYLIFTAGRQMATPARQIKRIIRFPRSIVPLGSRAWPVDGVFANEGVSTTLVTLSKYFGLPSVCGTPQQVLLIARGSELFGFAVDRVDGLASSIWTAGDTDKRQGDDAPIVNLGPADDRKVLPRLDLVGLLKEISPLPEDPTSGEGPGTKEDTGTAEDTGSDEQESVPA